MGKRLHEWDTSCTIPATGVALNIGLECNPGATPVQPLEGGNGTYGGNRSRKQDVRGRKKEVRSRK